MGRVGQARHSVSEILTTAIWLFPATCPAVGDVRIANHSIAGLYAVREDDPADHIDPLVTRIKLSVLQRHLVPSRAATEIHCDLPRSVIAAIVAML